MQDGQCGPEGMDACLARRSKTGMRVENWVQRAVQISLRVMGGGVETRRVKGADPLNS